MHLSRFLLTLLCTLAFVTAGSAQALVPGQIKAARVEQDVRRISSAGVKSALRNGDLLVETDTVVTGHGASVVLVFANGASVRLSEDSELSITVFKVDPLGEDKPVNAAALTEEPTASQTLLNLNHGEMVGKVAKLHTGRGSSFQVNTPVGAAGIRGTVFRVVFHPGDNGKAFFTIQTQEGVVVMSGVSTQEIPVPAGKETSVTADVTVSATGTVTVNSVAVANQTLSPSAAAAIESAATTILQAQQSTTFTSNTGGTTGGTSVKPSDTTTTAPDLSGSAGQ